MNSIGGYFELELRKGVEYHENAHRLNTGRNALELILQVKQFEKVFLPYYTCDVILEPFNKLKIGYEFYSLDKNLEPLFNYNRIKGNEGFLYTNYFGLKDSFISILSENCKNLIIDNSQAFYSLSKFGIPTFYSCRKYFGLPDGAYLYLDGITELDFPLDYSSGRFKHLFKRIEFDAEIGYSDFKVNDNSLIGLPIRQMSNLTKALLCNIDYGVVQKKRRENFSYINEHLSKYNYFKIRLDEESVPMVYPFLNNNTELKQRLMSNKIFVATYWPNVLDWVEKSSIEYKYASTLIHLPIDQRYSIDDMSFIVKILEEIINEKMD